MNAYGMSMGMDNSAYGAAMKAQGLNLYDMAERFGQPEASYMNQFQAGMGLGDVGGSMGSMGFDNMLPPNDQNMNYYQEYCRLFIANVVLTSQMKELIAEKNELIARVNDLEQRKPEKAQTVTSDDQKQKRHRRKKNEIDSMFKCPESNCQKAYGSEGSLFQHIRLKHPDLTANPDWKAQLVSQLGLTGVEDDSPKS